MVKVVDFLERKNREGDSFYVLVVQGGVEAVKSVATGKLYFTAKTATVPVTFEKETCKELIGKEFSGSIQKEQCEPFVYDVEETGEIITIASRNVYVDESLETIEENIIDEMVVR